MVTEIVRQIESGATEPFHCKLSDQQFYAVKGRRAQPEGLMAEVYAGVLAKNLGLPIPDFVVADVPKALVDGFHDHNVRASLGNGTAFASLWQELGDILKPSMVQTVDESLLATIYFFDHWIGNGDRSLTEAGGNVNLLYRLSDKQVFVIDHNLAFRNYNHTELATHVGQRAWRSLKSHKLFRKTLVSKIQLARESIVDLENELPDEWLEAYPDFPANVTERLNRVDTAEFWDELG